MAIRNVKHFNNEKFSLLTYQLIMLLSTLEILKVKILLVLAHVYPKQVTGAKLTGLIGYSKQANRLYRGILPAMEQEELILIQRQSKKLYSISINYDNPLMFHLIHISAQYGGKLSKRLLALVTG